MTAEVTITLDGTEHTLRATYGAAKGINTQFGGFRPAIEEVSKLNVAAIETIIAYGLDLTPRGIKEMKIGEKIFNTGIPLVAAPVVEFLTLLMTGGKSASADTEGKDGEGEA